MQLLLPLHVNVEYGLDDFIVTSCNASAYHAVLAETPIIARILIVGESGAGKSHLASIWHSKHNAIVLENNQDYTHTTHKPIILENIDIGYDAYYLFHIVNHCTEHGIRLLLTARQYPNFTLKDLQSRINATPLFLIEDPDEHLMRILLHKQFFDRQISISNEAVEYAIKRLERRFSSIQKFVETVDNYSLANKRMVTIPLIKMLLE